MFQIENEKVAQIFDAGTDCISMALTYHDDQRSV